MGQAISFIFGSLFGGMKRVENEKPRQNREDYDSLPSYFIDIIEEHKHNKAAAAFHHPQHFVVAISQEHEEEAASDALVESDLHQAHIATDSTVAGTASVKETKELIIKAALQETTFQSHHRSQQQQEAASDPLVEVDLNQPRITSNSIVAGTVRGKETKELTSKVNKSATIHRHHHVVTIPSQQQQHQQQRALSGPLIGVGFHQPLIATNSIVAGTAGGKETKEPTSSTSELYKATAIHRHHRAVAIPSQHQQQQQQQKAASWDPLVEVDFHQPLTTTNVICAITAGVKETKEQVIKAATEAVTSTKRKNKKKSPKNSEEIRKIGPYESWQKILLVGEGDFSFSASLATAFCGASSIVATSLDDKDFLLNNYRRSRVHIDALESRGALVIHDVDATKMAKHKSLKGIKFNRIIFNFPHSGAFGPTLDDLRQNQQLVSGFLRNAKKMIKEDGEIHVTHKTQPFFLKWNIPQLASMEGLNLIQESPFRHKVYPGYKTKYGYGGDQNFNCYPCKSYKFGLCGGS